RHAPPGPGAIGIGAARAQIGCKPGASRSDFSRTKISKIIGPTSVGPTRQARGSGSVELLELDVLEPAIGPVVLEPQVAGPVQVLELHLGELVRGAVGPLAGLGPAVEVDLGDVLPVQ